MLVPLFDLVPALVGFDVIGREVPNLSNPFSDLLFIAYRFVLDKKDALGDVPDKNFAEIPTLLILVLRFFFMSVRLSCTESLFFFVALYSITLFFFTLLHKFIYTYICLVLYTRIHAF